MDDRFLQFSISLSRLNKRVQALKTDAMGHIGLKGVHTILLYTLTQNPGGVRFAELCTKCDLDRAIVSRTLTELCGRELVAKQGEPGRYNASYVLTDTGAALAEQMVGAINRATAGAAAGISDRDLATFYKVLAKFQHNLANLQQAPAELFARDI